MRFAHVTHLLAYMGYYIFRPLLLPFLLLQRSFTYLFHVSMLLLFYIYKEEEEISETENTLVCDINATSNSSSPSCPERTEDSEMKQGNNNYKAVKYKI